MDFCFLNAFRRESVNRGIPFPAFGVRLVDKAGEDKPHHPLLISDFHGYCKSWSVAFISFQFSLFYHRERDLLGYLPGTLPGTVDQDQPFTGENRKEDKVLDPDPIRVPDHDLADLKQTERVEFSSRLSFIWTPPFDVI